MFGIMDHVRKNARVWCVMNIRHKEKLFPYVKINIYTPGIEDNREYATRIYSDCFSSYREEDFTNMDMLFRIFYKRTRTHNNNPKSSREYFWGPHKIIQI